MVLAALSLGMGFAFDYLADPLGLSPVLDARENLAWAERIAAGELPAEPFYRALLYPALLSLFPFPLWMAPFFGLLCHWLNALLCGLMARRLWQNTAAAWLAGLIYAVYPVSLYFSVQILDITFALTLFLLGVYGLLRLRERPSWWLAALAGGAAGLAVLARPNFLPAVLLFPALAVWLTYCHGRKWRPALMGGLALLAPLLGFFALQGGINHALSGEFRVLPWQGSYNLYAANREGANGKYFVQQLAFDEVARGMNPTRMESEYLYRQQAGPEATTSVAAMNAHWRAKLIESISEDPLRWLGLMGRKAAYLVNDWEQYNNLSYAYQKDRFPLLRWNPLGWGILLLGAAAALMLGWRRLGRQEASAVALVALAYAAGLLLFFVSARFRLPLAPFLCVGCGGLALLVRERGWWRRPGAGFAIGLLALLATLSYGDWWQARDRDTFIQDEVLLADAALRSGADAKALKYADKALARDPARQDVRRLQVSARFNLWLKAEGPAAEAHWEALLGAIQKIEQADAMTWFVRGVIEWRSGAREAAVAAWREGLERHGNQAASCARALQAVGEDGDWPPDDPAVAAIRALLER